jgi:hypothetical protein
MFSRPPWCLRPRVHGAGAPGPRGTAVRPRALSPVSGSRRQASSARVLYRNRALAVGDEREPALEVIVRDDARHANPVTRLDAMLLRVRENFLDTGRLGTVGPLRPEQPLALAVSRSRPIRTSTGRARLCGSVTVRGARGRPAWRYIERDPTVRSNRPQGGKLEAPGGLEGRVLCAVRARSAPGSDLGLTPV